MRTSYFPNLALSLLLCLSVLGSKSVAQAEPFCANETRILRYCTIAANSQSVIFARICGFFLRRAVNTCSEQALVCNACASASQLANAVCPNNILLCGQLTGVNFDCIRKQLDGNLTCSSGNSGNSTCAAGNQFQCIADQL